MAAAAVRCGWGRGRPQRAQLWYSRVEGQRVRGCSDSRLALACAIGLDCRAVDGIHLAKLHGASQVAGCHASGLVVGAGCGDGRATVQQPPANRLFTKGYITPLPWSAGWGITQNCGGVGDGVVYRRATADEGKREGRVWRLTGARRPARLAVDQGHTTGGTCAYMGFKKCQAESGQSGQVRCRSAAGRKRPVCNNTAV